MEGKRKRGRPRKHIDPGVIFHMIKNNAEITDVARHLGIHRDTIYTNYRQLIDQAREIHRAEWKALRDVELEKWLEEKRLKELSKGLSKRTHKPKRKYRRTGKYARKRLSIYCGETLVTSYLLPRPGSFRD
jgi:transposase-like protein